MHFVFQPSDKGRSSYRLSVNSSLPHRLSAFSAYSNPVCRSISDLTLDLPSIYSVEQQRRSETDPHVIINLIDICYFN